MQSADDGQPTIDTDFVDRAVPIRESVDVLNPEDEEATLLNELLL
jgi:hypothetical protein